MFVRTRGNSNQLIEKYRDEGGKSRQRVVCSLGTYETPKAALFAARNELGTLEGQAYSAVEARVELEGYIKSTFPRGLARHHGGEIPAFGDALARASRAARGEVEYDDYAFDFGGEDAEGYVELEDFIKALRELEELREDVRTAWAETAPRAHELRERIALLEDVVSR